MREKVPADAIIVTLHRMDVEKEDKTIYKESVASHYGGQKLPDFWAEEFEAIESAEQVALDTVPRPSTLSEVDAIFICKIVCTATRRARCPLKPEQRIKVTDAPELKKHAPAHGVAPNILVTVRWDSEHPDMAKMQAECESKAWATIALLWSEVAPGTAPTMGTTTIRHEIGSAVAGLDDGRHTLWEKVLRNDLPHTDVWIIMLADGFAIDLASWHYALQFVPDHCIIIFRFGAASYWRLTKTEIQAHIDNSASFWKNITPIPDIFKDWAVARSLKSLQAFSGWGIDF